MFEAIHDMLPLTMQVNLAITYVLVGLIWTIQLVHYPAFTYVENQRFTEFEQFHAKRISSLFCH